MKKVLRFIWSSEFVAGYALGSFMGLMIILFGGS